MTTLRIKRYLNMPFALALISGISLMPIASYAQNDTNFTPEQKKEIVSVVREALKKDPTILEDAIVSAQQANEQKRQEDASKTLAENKNLLMKQLPTDGLIGNPNATHTIVEFYDPRCPYCKKVVPELFQLVKENKDVKVILKVVPILGENSLLQAQAIVAATRQNAYVPMMKALMDTKETVTIDVIKTIAQQQKLDADRLVQDMNASSVTNALKNDVKLLRSLGIQGTPAFIINGSKIIPGAVSYADLKKAVEEQTK